MALCLTARQQEVLEYYQTYYKQHGFFPNTNEAGRHLKVHSPAVLNIIGALFLKGAFTDGKPLTVSYRGIHNTGANPSGMTFGQGKKVKKAKAAGGATLGSMTPDQFLQMLLALTGKAAQPTLQE